MKTSLLSPTTVQFFDPRDVRVLSASFVAAMETDKAYLLRLDPHRFLAWFRREAGLEPRAEVYGGWESSGVAGHSLGHYLSALSLMLAATGDPELRFRVDLIVSELAECQSANGNGYVAATPDGKTIYAQIAAGQIETKDAFTLNGGWVPLYTLHKLFAGLLDAYHHCDNEQACGVLLALTEWCWSVFGHLSHPQMQAVLYVEHGGMAEVLAEVYALTGDPRHLKLARQFRHDALFVPLSQGIDALDGFHANTQIPKFTGYQRLYELTGEEEWAKAARHFWDFVAEKRSYAIGGNSAGEHFFPLSGFEKTMEEAVGPETCNTYNMLKLTRRLFASEPKAALMNFYERGLWNHILTSQHPHGGFVYYTGVRPGAYRTYSTECDSFWCCVGTGMENHARYGEAIYAHSQDTLFVNLFIASQLSWAQMGARVTQRTDFPSEPRTQIEFTLEAPQRFKIAVRVSRWTSTGEFFLSVNGENAEFETSPAGYAELEREWQNGDVVSVEIPMKLSVELLPGSSRYGAILLGPIILAGVQGSDGLDAADFRGSSAPDISKFASGLLQPGISVPLEHVSDHIELIRDQPLTFRSKGLVSPSDVELRPLYTIHDERYSIYWPISEVLDSV